MQHVEEALAAAHVWASLNQAIGEDDTELADLFADRVSVDPFEEAEESGRYERVRNALAVPPKRERQIVELRFGFRGEPWTLEAIAGELRLTRERVRQLADQALRRIENDLAA
jgi:RNA polymerase sigma factor (sigma-70 family)